MMKFFFNNFLWKWQQNKKIENNKNIPLTILLEWLAFQIVDRIVDRNSINDFKMNQNLTIPLSLTHFFFFFFLPDYGSVLPHN